MTKDILDNHPKKSIEMRQIEEQIARLESQLKSPKVQIISDMPKGGKVEDMSQQVAKLVDLKKYYEGIWDNYINEKVEIEEFISTFRDPITRAILRYKYIEGKTDFIIGQNISYSEDRVTHIRLEALKKLTPDST